MDIITFLKYVRTKTLIEGLALSNKVLTYTHLGFTYEYRPSGLIAFPQLEQVSQGRQSLWQLNSTTTLHNPNFWDQTLTKKVYDYRRGLITLYPPLGPETHHHLDLEFTRKITGSLRASFQSSERFYFQHQLILVIQSTCQSSLA